MAGGPGVPDREIDERTRKELKRQGMKMAGEIIWRWVNGKWEFRLPVDNDLGAPLQFVAHVAPRVLHRPVMLVCHRVSGQNLWRLCVNSTHAEERTPRGQRTRVLVPTTHKHQHTDALGDRSRYLPDDIPEVVDDRQRARQRMRGVFYAFCEEIRIETDVRWYPPLNESGPLLVEGP
ncbi:hypothetical protein [Euzebya rosea]|uniref:hypothetical protein n=1 Tax=Euzebya rosea TaxID=2052804 RepID=UPI0013007D97|nr:hypothetical protein [Euzebya rosea]